MNNGYYKNELLQKVQDFSEEEIQVIESYSESILLNVKPLIVDSFQEYSKFLEEYQKLVQSLLARLTGTSFTLMI